MGLTGIYVISLATGMVLLLYSVHQLVPTTKPSTPPSGNIREMLRYSLPLYLRRLINRRA